MRLRDDWPWVEGQMRVQSNLMVSTICSGVTGGIVNYIEVSSAPGLRAMKDEHAYVSMATIELPCGRLRGVPESHPHAGLLALLFCFR